MKVITSIGLFISLCVIVRGEVCVNSYFIVSKYNNNFSIENILNKSSIKQNGDYEIFAVHSVMQKGYKILVFPNPTSDILNIKINEAPKGGFNISIYSFSGKELARETAEKGVLQLNLDLTSFETGSYLLKVADNKGGHLQTFQVIKN